MSIVKSVVIPVFGAPVSFHRVINYSVDVQAGTSTATLLQYFDQSASDAGCQPLNSEHVVIAGVPADTEPALAWIEKKLIEPTPPDDQGAAPNRYILSGGKRV
ncbi:hypothetical protein [Cupriavidus metallidurans]|uniref:hypothetical protein n=1 Tax=Cupriavidus metallidurans TaxID=119219 RepID=UPI001CCF015E|nr:hypothetical protein [Cupriavidus metallidurans]UBM12746.1 hypothetical protein LAI70_28445 [Cupriavidus metallidurans]